MRMLTLSVFIVALSTLSATALSAAPVSLAADVTAVTQPSVLASYARDSASQPGAGQWTVGIFNPLEIGITDDLSVLTHPLLILASPNVTLRYHVTDVAGFRVVAEAGLALPRLAMAAPLPLGLAGWFFPACKVSTHEQNGEGTCDRPGWILVPHLGAVASFGTDHVTSVRVEFAAGLP
ncbi:MAG TPA: hypothetical protein DCQ06_13290, partial [Myxococcales bacterium]|nr:hypothetical protein [Myxococcales bacterium]